MFNIPAGDTAALVAAINTSNINNEPDTIELAAGSTYTFTAAADPADGGSPCRPSSATPPTPTR